MKVTLKTITPNIEQTIVEIARVSSSRENKSEKPEGLLKYLIKNKHWSPFEHGSITMEIVTSKAIGIQLLRHRSFTFQEFSQRYQDINKVSDNGETFEPIEIRKQAEDNRQSSEEVFDPIYQGKSGLTCSQMANHICKTANDVYNRLVELGVAREQARMVLPMATKTKIYMTGTIRSWIHFIKLRTDEHAQKEIQLIGQEIKSIFKERLPITSAALNY